MAAIRRAETTWSGPLTTGSGTVSARTSAAFSDLPVSWAARTEESNGKTSPEELLAAAHAACFAMAFSADLGRAGRIRNNYRLTTGRTMNRSTCFGVIDLNTLGTAGTFENHR